MKKWIEPVTLIYLILITLSACSKTKEIEITSDKLLSIYNATVKPDMPLGKGVDLYVDYSTCVKLAVENSKFFKSVRPRITGIKMTLYSIKAMEINKVSDDMDTINEELNNISEIPYANIKGAIEKIVKSNNQAILITDGEYWTNPEGERTDLPYLKPSFEKWIQQGHSIYIKVERYNENYKGEVFSKKRYYFFFTDDNIVNNIYKEVSKADDFNQDDVSEFKLTSSDIKMTRHAKLNEALSEDQGSIKKISGFDFLEIQNTWAEIEKYGYPLLDNIELNRSQNYIINEVSVTAYNVSDFYLDKQMPIKDITDGFKLINKNGVYALNITKKLAGYLCGKNDKENLIRIDFRLNNVACKPIIKEWFTWHSMSKNAIENVSVYESIQQTLQDPLVMPDSRNSGIVYSVFIKTEAYY